MMMKAKISGTEDVAAQAARLRDVTLGQVMDLLVQGFLDSPFPPQRLKEEATEAIRRAVTPDGPGDGVEMTVENAVQYGPDGGTSITCSCADYPSFTIGGKVRVTKEEEAARAVYASAEGKRHERILVGVEAAVRGKAHDRRPALRPNIGERLQSGSLEVDCDDMRDVHIGDKVRITKIPEEGD